MPTMPTQCTWSQAAWEASAAWVASVDEAWVAWVVVVGAGQEDTAQTAGNPENIEQKSDFETMND